MIKKISIGIIFPLLILLNGCGKIKVASVAGEEIGYAKGILVGQGLQVKTIEKEMPDVPEGQVLTQNPPPETSIKKGELVTLTIAKSPLYGINGTFTLYESRLDSAEYPSLYEQKRYLKQAAIATLLVSALFFVSFVVS